MRHFLPAITDCKIRLAPVVGGSIVKDHFAEIKQQNDRCGFFGVCDMNSQALEGADASTGSKPFKNLTDMLVQCNAEAIIPTTPSDCVRSMQSAPHRRIVMALQKSR